MKGLIKSRQLANKWEESILEKNEKGWSTAAKYYHRLYTYVINKNEFITDLTLRISFSKDESLLPSELKSGLLDCTNISEKNLIAVNTLRDKY